VGEFTFGAAYGEGLTRGSKHSAIALILGREPMAAMRVARNKLSEPAVQRLQKRIIVAVTRPAGRPW
jgi:hypothetical protein